MKQKTANHTEDEYIEFENDDILFKILKQKSKGDKRVS